MLTSSSVSSVPMSSQQKRSRFWNLFAAVLLFGWLIGSSVYFAWKFHLYRDIKNWPSTSAVVIKQGGKLVPYVSETSYGRKVGSHDFRYTIYQYQVEGEVYQSKRVSPNRGKSIPPHFLENLQAYYHPEKPHLAVLNPISYSPGSPLTLLLFGWIAIGACLVIRWRSF